MRTTRIDVTRIGGLLFAALGLGVILLACDEDRALVDDAGPDAGEGTGDDETTDSGEPFPIDPQRIHDDIAFLADDARQGREAGTAGNQAALDYIAASFESMGLAPAGDDASYFDRFTYPEWRELSLPLLSVDDTTLVAGLDFDVLRYSPAGSGTGPIVFAGYGIVVDPYDSNEYPDCPYPAEGYDDYAGLDLDGAVVFRFANVPNGNTGLATACPLANGSERAAAAGALGFVTIRDYAWPYAELSAGVTLHWDVTYPLPVLGVSRAFAETLITDLAARYATLSGYAPASVSLVQSASFLVDATVEPNEISNVLGVVPGTDPALEDEVVVVSGHMDHVGRELGSDAIYNGADDNASGTAVMMELARAVAAMPDGPKRTMLFAAWNAEESGLHGSCAYVAEPHYPLDRTVAVLNLDAVGAGDGSGAFLISGADPLTSWFSLLMLNAANDQEVDGILIPTEHMESSDHTCFFAEGVPAVTMQTMGDRPTSHTQFDEIGVINLEDLLVAARLSLAAIGTLAAGSEDQYE